MIPLIIVQLSSFEEKFHIIEEAQLNNFKLISEMVSPIWFSGNRHDYLGLNFTISNSLRFN